MAPRKNQVALNKNDVDEFVADPGNQSSTGGKIGENNSEGSNSSSPKQIISKSSSFDGLSATMTGAISVDVQMAQMAQAIVDLQKTLKDKDLQIAQLMNKLEHSNVREPNHNHSSPPSHNANETQLNELPLPRESAPKFNHSDTSVAALTIQQLQEIITNTLRAQQGATSQDSLVYSKPYTKKIGALKMPMGYQPPKLQQFDGSGNPRQHVAHFIETCNNAGTYGDLLVKQFVRSLKDNAFDWYIDLEPESIDSWEQLENEFLSRFYSTRRIVSMIELSNTRQWMDEPVIDYIDRWRNLSLNCKEQLCENSAIEMCVQGMHWGLCYILQAIKPQSFEELVTRAYDMEFSISASREDGEVYENHEDDGGNFSSSPNHKCS